MGEEEAFLQGTPVAEAFEAAPDAEAGILLVDVYRIGETLGARVPGGRARSDGAALSSDIGAIELA